MSGDNVRLSSSDLAVSTPVSGLLTNGFRQFSVALNTVGSPQTLSGTDLTNGSIQGMTSPGILVLPNAVDHFVISTITSPQVAGVPVAVTIRATDAGSLSWTASSKPRRSTLRPSPLPMIPAPTKPTLGFSVIAVSFSSAGTSRRERGGDPRPAPPATCAQSRRPPALGIAAVDMELTNHRDTDFDKNLKALRAFLTWQP